LEQQLKLGQQIFVETVQSRRVLAEIDSVQKQLSDLQPKLAEHAELNAAAADAATALQNILTHGEAPSAMGLQTAISGLASALRVVESGDRAVPAQALELYKEAGSAVKLKIGEWDQFKTKRLPQLNQQLQQAGIAPIAITDPSHPAH
jgi:hypothetical protein